MAPLLVTQAPNRATQLRVATPASPSVVLALVQLRRRPLVQLRQRQLVQLPTMLLLMMTRVHPMALVRPY